jgi:glycosyltransferase involved in cell wall biosynthesis
LSAGIDVRATGYVDDKHFLDYINVSDFALSLRTVSRGESSAALLYLLSHGIPTIVYDVGFFSEIDDKAVLKVPLSDIEALKNRIEELAASEELRKTTSIHARDFAGRFHWPTRLEGYKDIIYQSLEYKARVKKYAKTIKTMDSEVIEYLARSFSY